MSSQSPNVYGVHALCSFDADAAAAAFRQQRGFASFVRNGAGDYTLTLSEAIAQNDFIGIASSQDAAFNGIAVQWVTTTTVRVRTATLAAAPSVTAADADFTLVIYKMSPA